MTTTMKNEIMYPPRAGTAISPEEIQKYENMGYAAQFQYSGIRMLVSNSIAQTSMQNKTNKVLDKLNIFV